MYYIYGRLWHIYTLIRESVFDLLWSDLNSDGEDNISIYEGNETRLKCDREQKKKHLELWNWTHGFSRMNQGLYSPLTRWLWLNKNGFRHICALWRSQVIANSPFPFTYLMASNTINRMGLHPGHFKRLLTDLLYLNTMAYCILHLMHASIQRCCTFSYIQT